MKTETRLADLDNLQRLRPMVLAAATLIGLFMVVDLTVLPENLQFPYLVNRLLIQVPLVVLFLAFTYSPLFERYRDWVLLPLVIALAYANIGFIIYCWVHEGFAFSYEGTALYALFVFVVLRPQFRFAVALVSTIAIGMGITLYTYPIYGEFNAINYGFVLATLAVGLAGIYIIDSAHAELRQSNQQLLEASRIDHLTRLYNRRTLENEFATTLEHCKRAGQQISVLMIDIDHFKDYNDGYGHQAGDVVIQMQADILRRVFKRGGDVIGRFGGTEFLVVSVGQSQTEALAQAESILAGWRRERCSHGIGEGDTHVSCSIGVYHGSLDIYDDMARLEKYAEIALHHAKSNGRARTELYQSELANVTAISS